MAAFNRTAGVVLRRLAVGGSAVALGAALFAAHPAGASTTGHGSSAQAAAHQHQSDQAKQAAERAKQAAKQAAERAKQVAQAKRAQAEKAKAEKAKADQAKKAEQAARKQAAEASHAATKAGHAANKAAAKTQAAAAKAQAAAEKAQAEAAAKAQAAVTKALRKAGLLTGNGDNGNTGNGNPGNGDNGSGDQPVTPAGTGKSGLPTGHKQQPPVSTGKSGNTGPAATTTRQSGPAGSVFVANSALAGSRSVPVSKPVQHLAVVKQIKPRTPLAVPPAKVLQVQTPIQLVQAGLSIGVGPLVLLGLVVIGGLATVVAGTRRRSTGQHR